MEVRPRRRRRRRRSEFCVTLLGCCDWVIVDGEGVGGGPTRAVKDGNFVKRTWKHERKGKSGKEAARRRHNSQIIIVGVDAPALEFTGEGNASFKRGEGRQAEQKGE
ncbi:hypothetical protein HAX54_030681 [Datura stramonium]|uniref:Uncharacterized protein n=1 Tax=Datura stramonium TaxID=4076 RepID=A0ABS8SB83_DATST|nr:hypothetical protein [Datura stramonium]